MKRWMKELHGDATSSLPPLLSHHNDESGPEFFGGILGCYGKVGGVFAEGVEVMMATELLGGHPSVDGASCALGCLPLVNDGTIVMMMFNVKCQRPCDDRTGTRDKVTCRGGERKGDGATLSLLLLLVATD